MGRRRRRRRKHGAGSPPPPLAALAAPLGAGARPPESAGTWWSRRWIAAVDSFGGFGTHGRGRRREGVLALHIEPGIVLAQVQSGRPEPFIVRADMTPLAPEVWDEIIGGMAQKAVFAAKLLSGEMPEEVEEAFKDAGTALLPQTSEDIPSSCTCHDPLMPCRHVAAVHTILAEEFDRDPFLIFKLRGCPKEQLLAALRRKRAASGSEPDEPAVTPGESLSPEAFWHAGDALSEFAINIAPPLTHAGLLRQLGMPAIEGGDAFLEMMAALYQRVMASVLEDALKGQRMIASAPVATPVPERQEPGGGEALPATTN
ncbi:MAG: hypothetical protein U0166_21715 [Acidobacteriota bacterium]